MVIFSHPAFVPGPTYTVVGYNLVKSVGGANAPSFFGPWVPVQSNYTNNMDIVDATGGYWDLYRVQPIIQLTSSGQQISLDFSRPFYARTPLYDGQINQLIDNFRRNWIDDVGIQSTDSTVITESTGAGANPFITDAQTSRFYLSFIPNADPIRFIQEDVIVTLNAGDPSAEGATPLAPYVDYFPRGDDGFIDFKTNPPTNSYLKAEYKSVTYSNDDIRNMLTNAVSDLQNYGLDGYLVQQSWNLTYLTTPLANRDIANIVCMVAQRNLLGSQIQSSFKSAEAWRDGKVEYTADPSRSIQAGTLWHTSLGDEIHRAVSNYIIGTRTYFSRGEYDSFFDTSGALFVYNNYFNLFAQISWWL